MYPPIFDTVEEYKAEIEKCRETMEVHYKNLETKTKTSELEDEMTKIKELTHAIQTMNIRITMIEEDQRKVRYDVGFVAIPKNQDIDDLELADLIWSKLDDLEDEGVIEMVGRMKVDKLPQITPEGEDTNGTIE